MEPALERRKKMMKELSITLKKYRNKYKFTQEQIAEVLGMERSSYSYIENGKIMPSI